MFVGNLVSWTLFLSSFFDKENRTKQNNSEVSSAHSNRIKQKKNPEVSSAHSNSWCSSLSVWGKYIAILLKDKQYSSEWVLPCTYIVISNCHLIQLANLFLFLLFSLVTIKSFFSSKPNYHLQNPSHFPCLGFAFLDWGIFNVCSLPLSFQTLTFSTCISTSGVLTFIFNSWKHINCTLLP